MENEIEIKAPFGFTWGMSEEDLKKLALPISGRKIGGKEGFVICLTGNAPKPVPFANGYNLVFAADKGLQAVWAEGDRDEHAFEQLKRALVLTYGVPDKEEMFSPKDGRHGELSREFGHKEVVWEEEKGGKIALVIADAEMHLLYGTATFTASAHASSLKKKASENPSFALRVSTAINRQKNRGADADSSLDDEDKGDVQVQKFSASESFAVKGKRESVAQQRQRKKEEARKKAEAEAKRAVDEYGL